MSDNHPGLAEAIETAVQQGATPREIRRLVMDLTSRTELAQRCEQAAAAMAR